MYTSRLKDDPNDAAAAAVVSVPLDDLPDHVFADPG